MKQTPSLFQPLKHGSFSQPDSERISDKLERLKLLVPEASPIDSCDLLALALAYVEHYRGDVLQLEHEREFLFGAVTQAWQQAAYSVVVRLVTGLAQLAGRFSNYAEAELLLHLGIAASRRTHDQQHLSYFLNRLGGLLFSHGKYRRGRRVWHTSLQLDGSSGSSIGLWDPLSSFTHIADILGNYSAAQQFVETLLNTRRNEDPDSFAVALFIRGFYARHMRHLDSAYEDFSNCLRLLSLRRSDSPTSSYRQLFTMAAQAELARVQGNYTRSQEYTETALALAQIFSDHYTSATLLIDQGLFSYQQGKYADTQVTFLRLRALASQMAAPHVNKCSSFLERHLARVSPENCRDIAGRQDQLALSTPPVKLHESLSERELEVLQLVAAGLSNREIAGRLVITTGTVKKHLEHIYTTLNVHSRTSAIAKARTIQLLT